MGMHTNWTNSFTIPKLSECLTMNEMHNKLASLIICTTNDNLANMSSTLPPEVKKTIVLYIAHIMFYTSTKTFIYWKFKDKIFNLFSVLNQHKCCITVRRKFLQLLISVLGKWSIKMQWVSSSF